MEWNGNKSRLKSNRATLKSWNSMSKSCAICGEMWTQKWLGGPTPVALQVTTAPMVTLLRQLCLIFEAFLIHPTFLVFPAPWCLYYICFTLTVSQSQWHRLSSEIWVEDSWSHVSCIIHAPKTNVTWMIPRSTTSWSKSWAFLQLAGGVRGLWGPEWLRMLNYFQGINFCSLGYCSSRAQGPTALFSEQNFSFLEFWACKQWRPSGSCDAFITTFLLSCSKILDFLTLIFSATEFIFAPLCRNQTYWSFFSGSTWKFLNHSAELFLLDSQAELPKGPQQKPSHCFNIKLTWNFYCQINESGVLNLFWKISGLKQNAKIWHRDLQSYCQWGPSFYLKLLEPGIFQLHCSQHPDVLSSDQILPQISANSILGLLLQLVSQTLAKLLI